MTFEHLFFVVNIKDLIFPYIRCDRTIILDFSITGTTCIAQEKVDKKEYVHHAFPEGFKAHWVRVTSDTDGVITAFYLSII